MTKYITINIERAIVERLQQVFAEEFPGVEVISAPGDEEEKYNNAGLQGSVLVRFNSDVPIDPPVMQAPFPTGMEQVLTQQPAKRKEKQQIEFLVLVGVGSDSADNAHHNALMYLQTAKYALSGHTVEAAEKLYTTLRAGEARIHQYENFIWFYYMRVKTDPF